MTVADVRGGLADVLTAQGLRAFRYVPETVNPPCAVVLEPDSVTYHATGKLSKANGAVKRIAAAEKPRSKQRGAVGNVSGRLGILGQQCASCLRLCDGRSGRKGDQLIFAVVLNPEQCLDIFHGRPRCHCAAFTCWPGGRRAPQQAAGAAGQVTQHRG